MIKSSKKSDILNQRYFGELEVLEATDIRLHGRIVYKCKCSCGNICYVKASRLVEGVTQSCGHLKTGRGSKSRIDWKGKQVDDFLVIEYSHNQTTTKSHPAIWKCRCTTCGQERFLSNYYLKMHYRTRCNHMKTQ